MAKKLQGLSRVLGPRPLASVAYGEIASSLYFALGIVAFYALGFTPWVLLFAGRGLHPRRALLRGGHRGDPRDRRRGHASSGAPSTTRRLHDRLGALPRLPDRDRAGGAVRAALPRRGGRCDALADEPWDVVVGRRRDRRDRGRAARAPAAASTGSRSSSPVIALVVQLPLICSDSPPRSRLGPRGGRRPRHGADVGVDRLRRPAGDARLHRPRDRRQPRGGGTRAGHGRCRAACSPASARRSSSRSRSASSPSRRFPEEGRPRSARVDRRAAGRDCRRARGCGPLSGWWRMR